MSPLIKTLDKILELKNGPNVVGWGVSRRQASNTQINDRIIILVDKKSHSMPGKLSQVSYDIIEVGNIVALDSK